jgi:hypothetical protein
MEYDAKPGDVIFYDDNSIMAWLIKFFTQSPGEEKSFSEHVAGMVDDTNLIEAWFYVRKRPVAVDKEHRAMQVFRYVGPMPVADMSPVVAKAEDYLGRVYGVMKLFTHLADALLVKIFKKEIYFFRKLNHRDKYPICSWLWAFAYYKGFNGYEFGCPPEGASPDDMHDFVKESSDWEMVFSKEIKK